MSSRMKYWIRKYTKERLAERLVERGRGRAGSEMEESSWDTFFSNNMSAFEGPSTHTLSLLSISEVFVYSVSC